MIKMREMKPTYSDSEYHDGSYYVEEGGGRGGGR